MSARKKTGGRPPISDRDSVRSELVTLKLSPGERDLLDRLIELRATELRVETSGARIAVSASSYIRGLILRDAEAKGLITSSEAKEKPTKRRRTSG